MIVNCGTCDEPNRDAKPLCLFAIRFLQKSIGATLDALSPFFRKRLSGKPVYSERKEWVPFR